ncbi:MAG: pilus assembly protein PilM [Candidatus Ratteibacteria bacterium]
MDQTELEKMMNSDQKENKIKFLEILRLKKNKAAAEAMDVRVRAKEELRKQKEAARQAALAKKETLLREREELRQQAIVKTEAQFREKEAAKQRELEFKQKQSTEERRNKEEIAAGRLKETEERKAAAIKTKEELQKQKEAARQAALAKKETLLREREELRQQAIVKKEEIKQNKSLKMTTPSQKKFGGQTTVAVDIGSRYVKLAVINGDGKLKAIEFARRPVENNETATLLSGWVSKHHLERKPVFSSISNSEINVQYLSLPALTGKELTGAIKIEASQILGEDLSLMDSDFSLIDQKNEKRGILFVAAPQILSDERISLLKSTGLNPTGLTIDSIALANGYLANTGNGSEATLLLNIGHRRSNLAVVEKNKLLFVRDILWGNERIIAEIVSANNFDAPTVLEMLEEKKHSLIAFPDAIDKTTKTLLDELEKTISYCQQVLEIKVKKLVVTGGGGQIPSLPKFIGERILLELEPYPVLKDDGLQTERGKNLAPFLAILAGLSPRNGVNS